MSEHSPGRYCIGCRNPHSACTCGVEEAEAQEADDGCCPECDTDPCMCEDDMLAGSGTDCPVCGDHDCDCFDTCEECRELNCECICEDPPSFFGDEGEDYL